MLANTHMYGSLPILLHSKVFFLAGGTTVVGVVQGFEAVEGLIFVILKVDGKKSPVRLPRDSVHLVTQQ
ncbi:hypothetical protein GY45DRAFT_1331078 [Cubamyces sp. BRFM 1775]|nr:hypothetical protein GY45DRAFT_1331078 [Cubamyces sp. BRFM 1775]